MAGNPQQELTFGTLEARLRLLLPDQYQARYGDVQPVSMGSAGLRYEPDGTVAWNNIWQSFCDLALAGGPPHRGTLLEPGAPAAVAEQPARYQAVVAELCRGLHLVTGLYADPAGPGWVKLFCTGAAMAAWLARAITVENISARAQGLELWLPAGPAYRVEKEIKNVITAVAKTCHYWLHHISPEHQGQIAALFREIDAESPLLVPESSGHTPEAHLELTQAISHRTGLHASIATGGWLAVDCVQVSAAVWIMRLLVVQNVLSRREATTVLVPLNAAADPQGEAVLAAFTRAHHFAQSRAIL